jgi:hypothetical protein
MTPLCPPISHGLQDNLPVEGYCNSSSPHPLFLRVSLLNKFVSNFIFWNTISIWNSNVITIEQLRNNLFA